MNVLGLSGYFHDAAAALIVDGQLVAAAQVKHVSHIGLGKGGIELDSVPESWRQLIQGDFPPSNSTSLISPRLTRRR